MMLCCASTLGSMVGNGDEPETPTEVATESESVSTAPTTEGPTFWGLTEEPSSAAPEPEPEPTTEEAEEVYYENCDAARAAGAAPVREGDPGYRSGLDRDGDGIGCEDSSSGGGSDSGGDSGGGSDDGDDSSSVYYENCDAVRAAGADPIHRGDPGYRSGLDRDGDGVGCE
nr:hypothetical protein GCM10025732_06230 [Glycomyces mayteni]